MVSSGDCGTDSCSYDGFLQYEPSLAGNVVLLAFFAILIPIAIFLGIRYQSLIFSATLVTGLLLEVVGYIGRVLLTSSTNAYKAEFVLSQLGTILAPTVISLAVFRLMPRVVAAYGEQYRAWRPTWHNVVFYAFTTICFVLQAIGVLLSTVPDDSTLDDIGTRLLVAGLAIQVSSLFIFTLLGVRFVLAVRQRKGALDPSGLMVYNTLRFKSFLTALTVATLLLVIRTIYRMIAIAEGLFSSLAQNETLFLVLDGVFVLVVVALLLASFPGRMLGSSRSDSTIHSRRTSQKITNRPAPIQLERASYATHHNRTSMKSNATTSPKNTYSPKTSPRRSNVAPPTRRNMVDHEQLW
ncbi:RTA1 like protein [Seiridium cupressi]